MWPPEYSLRAYTNLAADDYHYRQKSVHSGLQTYEEHKTLFSTNPMYARAAITACSAILADLMLANRRGSWRKTSIIQHEEAMVFEDYITEATEESL